MRAALIAVLLLAAFYSPASAGVYNLDRSAEPVGYPDPDGIPDRIFQLRAAGIAPKGELDEFSPRAKYLRQVAHFEPMRQAGTLSTVDAVTYAAALLRLDQVRDARRVLREADQEHFLVQASLAATYHQGATTRDDYQQAAYHQRLALKLWPAVWAGWSSGQLAMYRRCEQFNLRLLEARAKAASDHRGATAGELDPIFPGVRFVSNKQGKYAAGEIDRDMADKLPDNVGQIALQLALWQPRDRRLCWLVAELLNAQGHIEPAFRLMDSMVVSDKLPWDELFLHHRVLARARESMRVLKKTPNAQILWSELTMIPRATFGPPVAGDLAYYAATLAYPVTVQGLEEEQKKRQANPQADQPETPYVNPPLPFNVQHVAVSFIFGALVAALIGLQWQYWRKRRAAEVTRKPDGVMHQAPPS
jgi:hypothetical protein